MHVEGKYESGLEIACPRQVGTGFCLQNTSDIVDSIICQQSSLPRNGHTNRAISVDSDEESADEKPVGIFIARL